ncbi:MAG: HAD family hydrolase [Vicinamibacterales bacterium]
MSYSLAVFDFDGTLVDSEACIRQSLARALEAHGLPVAGGIRKEWIGLPLQAIIRSACGAVDDADVDSIIAAYRAHYAALDAELTFAFPGMIDALEALAAAGVRLAIATNKHSRPARATLDRLGLSRLFQVIVGAESVANPKPHPDLLLRVLADTGHDADAAVMIGDATVDLQMASSAGVASCAVTWGNHSIEQLLACSPRHVVRSPAEIPRLVATKITKTV